MYLETSTDIKQWMYLFIPLHKDDLMRVLIAILLTRPCVYFWYIFQDKKKNIFHQSNYVSSFGSVDGDVNSGLKGGVQNHRKITTTNTTNTRRSEMKFVTHDVFRAQSNTSVHLRPSDV